MASATDFIIRQLQDPKAAVGVFTLPCGYLDRDGQIHREVEVREITGAEEDLLASRTTPAGQKMNALIAACTTRIGSVTDRSAIHEAVLDLPVGDRVMLLLAIRAVSLGDVYHFEGKCPECSANNTFAVAISELEVKEMKDPSKRIYEVTLPRSGLVARCRILTGRGEEKIAKASRKSEDTLTLAILGRLESLGGNPPDLASVKRLGIADRNALRAAFEENEGGVITEVDAGCPACGAEFLADLDIGQQGFFFPSAVKKGSSRMSSI